MTHTYVILEISDEAFQEIAKLLRDASYHQVFDTVDGQLVMDMHGIALKSEVNKKPAENAKTDIRLIVAENSGRQKLAGLVRAAGRLKPYISWNGPLSKAASLQEEYGSKDLRFYGLTIGWVGLGFIFGIDRNPCEHKNRGYGRLFEYCKDCDAWPLHPRS